MPTARINKELNSGIYFLTPTIRNWYYIFDRHDRWQIIADSLDYCQASKGLKVFGYVFMLNHLHLMVGSEDVAGFIRDFKRHTSTKLRANLAENEPNVLSLFLDEDGQYQFWKPDNQPKRIESESFFRQKMKYIHQNPVRKGYVEEPAHWKWSSANPNSPVIVTNIS
jgi:REP element-mobilizing transposase RayT